MNACNYLLKWYTVPVEYIAPAGAYTGGIALEKIPMSVFLQEHKPFMHALVAALGKHFSYASVLGTDVTGKRYTVADKTTAINDGMWGERGFVARVYREGRYFEYSFNEIADGGAEALADEIARYAHNAFAASPEAALYPPPEEETVTRTFYGEVVLLPEAVSPGDVVARLSAFNRKAHECSPLLAEFIATVGYARVSKVFVSAHKDLEQSYIWAEAYLMPVARRDDVTREAFRSYSGLKGFEILDEMDSDVSTVVSGVCELLDAEPIAPGEYEVICSPDAVGIIAHEAFGHGVELDMFVKNRANAKHYIDKAVASPVVNMRDGAASVQQVSSYLFDDEGTLAGDTKIIENGILRAGLSDMLSAMKLGLPPTGNGKRESFERKAYSRMTNTFFEPGTDTLEAMIASVQHGYLIEDAESGMEDPKDWGIQVMFTSAREIVDGKLTGRWVAPVVMTGYVPDLLKAITMVSGDFKLSGSGGCGKGHKEWVKVSCGGPYIKTRARLG